MATDVARLSFDPARRYSGVAAQQGRVTLEAEENEERVILIHERRLELLDLVGPAATPDDGYAVSPASGFDITIGVGTMYVGGIRVELDHDITYSQQPDWLDHEGDPEFTPLPDAKGVKGDEHIVLVLAETDVTATEDPVLREVALGGPDGAARTRIVQHIRRLENSGGDCASALSTDEAVWAAEGLTFDAATARLLSLSRLEVRFDVASVSDDPCEPSAKGGYLGADNQAIRIQIAAVNGDGTFDLLWGWDNASFLYRVSADPSTNPVLTLDRSPVDDYHRPRTGQAVQVLRAAAELPTTDGTIEGYVAALNGAVGVLAAPYDPDTRTVEFPAPLPATYTDPAKTPQLYMRVWEQVLPGHSLGDDIALTGTGLKVTLTAVSGTRLHVGDHWTIAVRPSTPDTVLPARYLRAPQPPDGPRMWACPLAVIGWLKNQFQLLDDCRGPWRGKDCGCCCEVTIKPEDASEPGLQAILDAAAARRGPADRASRIAVCLRPGRYELERPLLLDNRHSHMALEGCGEGVVFAARAGSEEAFAQGLVELVHADNVSFSGLEFVLPQVPAAAAKIVPQEQELRAFVRPLTAVYRDLYVSIGIRPVHCAALDVDRCVFRFTAGDAVSGAAPVRNVFAAAVFAGSECWGMRVSGCRFLHHAAARAAGATGAAPVHLLVGILATPSLVYKSGSTKIGGDLPSASVIRTLLTRATIEDNEFAGLTAAALAIAELGDVRFSANQVRSCYAGISLASLRAHAYADLAGRYTIAAEVAQEKLSELGTAMVAAAADEALMTASVVARTYPLPSSFVATAADRKIAAHVVQEEHKAAATQWMQQFLAKALSPFTGGEVAVKSEAPDEPAPSAEPSSTFSAGGLPSAGTRRATAAQTVHTLLSDYELAAAFQPPSQRFELRVAGNDIDCVAASGGQSGPALLVWESDAALGSALIDDDRFITQGSAAAMLLGVPFVLFNANLVLNADPKSIALVTIGASRVAVTGNVTEGVVSVPGPRPFPSPLDAWNSLNTFA